MAAISVIIPAYNAEQYLARCLDSLLAQTFTDWEAIVVNDGSRDGTGALLERYAAGDARIRALTKVNGGVSAARNLGLEAATGTFLLFVDSDDFLHPQTMEICHAQALRDSSDLVAFTYSRSYRTRLLLRHLFHLKDTAPRFPHFRRPQSLVTDRLLDWATEYSRGEKGQDKRFLVKHCQPWRCLYRRDCIGHLRFPEGIIYEDFPWWGQVLLCVKKASILNLPLYYYYPNPRSYILSSRNTFKLESLRKALALAEPLFAGAPEQDRLLWERHFLQPFRAHLKRKQR